jgi:HSP20 family protein
MPTTWFDTPLFADLEAFRRDVDALLSTPSTLSGHNRSLGRGLQLSEQSDHYAVTADLPGMTHDDVSLDLRARRLVVRAARTVSPPEGFQPHHRERKSWRFERSIALPTDVDADTISAALEQGILCITLPRVAETRPRRIKITEPTGSPS